MTSIFLVFIMPKVIHLKLTSHQITSAVSHTAAKKVWDSRRANRPTSTRREPFEWRWPQWGDFPFNRPWHPSRQSTCMIRQRLCMLVFLQYWSAASLHRDEDKGSKKDKGVGEFERRHVFSWTSTTLHTDIASICSSCNSSISKNKMNIVSKEARIIQKHRYHVATVTALPLRDDTNTASKTRLAISKTNSTNLINSIPILYEQLLDRLQSLFEL